MTLDNYQVCFAPKSTFLNLFGLLRKLKLSLGGREVGGCLYSVIEMVMEMPRAMGPEVIFIHNFL